MDPADYHIEVDRYSGDARLVCGRCAGTEPWDGDVPLDGERSFTVAALTDLTDAAEQHERTAHVPTIRIG